MPATCFPAAAGLAATWSGCTAAAVAAATGEEALAEGVSDDLPAPGPRILLCLDGTVTVAAGGSTESLAPGGAVFLSAADGPVSVVGDGRVAVCSVPG